MKGDISTNIPSKKISVVHLLYGTLAEIENKKRNKSKLTGKEETYSSQARHFLELCRRTKN